MYRIIHKCHCYLILWVYESSSDSIAWLPSFVLIASLALKYSQRARLIKKKKKKVDYEPWNVLVVRLISIRHNEQTWLPSSTDACKFLTLIWGVHFILHCFIFSSVFLNMRVFLSLTSSFSGEGGMEIKFRGPRTRSRRGLHGPLDLFWPYPTAITV